MIIVKLKGGLGNQMFQYAFGKKLSVERKDILKLDKTLVENRISQRIIGTTLRHYELNEFNIYPEFIQPSERFLPSWGYIEQLCLIAYKIVALLGKTAPTILRETSASPKSNLKKISQTRGDIFLDGFWQSEEYFKDIKQVIDKGFTLRKGSINFIKLANIIAKTNSVSIHFRRGDYVSKTLHKIHHGILGLNYYRKTVKLMCQKVKNPHLFIFSDDIDWGQKNFKIDYPTTYIKKSYKLTNPEELILMSFCKHNIIANSSFSWWGAWLNKNPSKVIIAPKRWFRKERTESGIIPQGWIRVENNF